MLFNRSLYDTQEDCERTVAFIALVKVVFSAALEASGRFGISAQRYGSSDHKIYEMSTKRYVNSEMIRLASKSFHCSSNAYAMLC